MTPTDARRRFLVRLTAATSAATLASFAAALGLQGVATSGRLPGDAVLDPGVDALLDVHSSLWISGFTSSAMITPLLVLAAVLAARAGVWHRAVLALVAYAASKLIAIAGWLTWSRARPADVAGGMLVPESLSSFPSGHAVQVITVYGLFALWWAAATNRAWERALAWLLVLLGVLVIGAARVRLGAHHPSDIIGGAALAALWLGGAAWAERAVRPPGRASGPP